MDMLWSQLTKVKKVKCQDWNKIWKNFLQNPSKSFKKLTKTAKRTSEDNETSLSKEQEKVGFGDEMMPEVTEGNKNMRQKYLHQQGVVTKAKFVPFRSVVRRRGYTGIFKTGADDVILRFSTSGQHLEGVTNSLNPAIAIKFLRSGVISGNQFGMLGFDNV